MQELSMDEMFDPIAAMRSFLINLFLLLLDTFKIRLHSISGVLAHLLCYMSVDIQCESYRSMSKIF